MLHLFRSLRSSAIYAFIFMRPLVSCVHNCGLGSLFPYFPLHVQGSGYTEPIRILFLHQGRISEIEQGEVTAHVFLPVYKGNLCAIST